MNLCSNCCWGELAKLAFMGSVAVSVREHTSSPVEVQVKVMCTSRPWTTGLKLKFSVTSLLTKTPIPAIHSYWRTALTTTCKKMCFLKVCCCLNCLAMNMQCWQSLIPRIFELPKAEKWRTLSGSVLVYLNVNTPGSFPIPHGQLSPIRMFSPLSLSI